MLTKRGYGSRARISLSLADRRLRFGAGAVPIDISGRFRRVESGVYRGRTRGGAARHPKDRQPGEQRGRAREILQRFRHSRNATPMPSAGIQLVVSANGSPLARALVLRPRLLILDESSPDSIC